MFAYQHVKCAGFHGIFSYFSGYHSVSVPSHLKWFKRPYWIPFLLLTTQAGIVQHTHIAMNQEVANPVFHGGGEVVPLSLPPNDSNWIRMHLVPYVECEHVIRNMQLSWRHSVHITISHNEFTIKPLITNEMFNVRLLKITYMSNLYGLLKGKFR